MPSTSLRGCLTGMDDPQDGLSLAGRQDEDRRHVLVAIVAVILGVVVGAENLQEVTS